MALSVLCMILSPVLLPVISADDVDHIKGFDKGPSYEPVIPLKKITFVNYDENSYLDDYAYLAAVPTAVFDDGGRLFSHPLVFYQDTYYVTEDKERSLNARQGIDYFMEDWMSYCNGKADQMTLINIPKNKLDSSWRAREYATIEYDNPYDIASELALNEWSYSSDAVIAVIDESFEKSDYEISGELSRGMPAKKIKSEHFETPQTNDLNPVFNEFNVPKGYRYLKARAWYPCFYWESEILKGFQVSSNISVPAGDKDIQLYCKHKGEWMQTSVRSEWNQKFGMDTDIVQSYVYENGQWRVGITDVPTKGIGKYGTIREILKEMRTGVEYQVEVKLYPGVEISVPDTPPFGCRNAKFELSWDNSNVNLGFSLIGPGGEEVLTVINESRTDFQEMHLDQLGECLENECYSICVFALNDVSTDFDFKISYSWEQGISEEYGDSLTSATEGAVLASTLNAPLVYTKKTELPEATRDCLYKIGVEKIHLVDIGDNINSDAFDEIKKIAEVEKHYTLFEDINTAIRDKTGSNDVVFSTLDPWSYWYVAEMKVAGEYPGALFLGPAAYIAAYHGTPVLIVDSHPHLSSAVVWHNEFWKRTARSPDEHTLSVSEMYLTGKRVYDFLKKYEFDKPGRESIVTVAGQFDISPSWDRMFPGMAKPGRFMYSPVDCAYWISRNIFYPALIFVNPAMSSSGVELINGSINERRTLLARGPFGLKTIRDAGEETLKYPVHMTFVSYQHRWNERTSKYYGSKYQSADGIVPSETRSFEPIDQGSIKKYTGQDGSFWPDMSPSEVIPFYMERGGFDSAFCSNFEDTMYNLNQGVLYWHLGSHGGHPNSGSVLFWDPQEKGKEIGAMPASLPIPPGSAGRKDLNPWRSYDWYLGSTDEPDTLTADIHGVIPSVLGNPNFNGLLRTAIDWAPAKKPIRDLMNNILAKIPIINRLLPEGQLDTQDYYDGGICVSLFSKMGYSFYTGWNVDDTLGNLHSMVFNTGVCLVAGKYMHLAMVRHGSVGQIIDPWSTSWYSAMWAQSIPRDIILGDTMGEAYNKGISHVGILYIGDNDGPQQWWWDEYENVCYFGDPNLRMFVPGKTYSDTNYWEKEDTMPLRYDVDLSIDGHMPFGAAEYPHEKEPEIMLPLWVIATILIVSIVIVSLVIVTLKKTKKKQ